MHSAEYELAARDPALLEHLRNSDSGPRAAAELRARFPPNEVAQDGDAQQIWALAGLYYRDERRLHESIGVFWALYQRMLEAQAPGQRVHKGMPLVWIGECYRRLGFRVHAKRYLMLTLCEDALHTEGHVQPNETGSYFRLVWGGGLRDAEFHRYAGLFWELRDSCAEARFFPEALLQRVDDGWMTELPSADEAFVYVANEAYIEALVNRLGERTGEALEQLAEYVLSCMPGCHTRRRLRSWSTDYDVVCSVDGLDIDFRSELGRYFVCECKDWRSRVNYSTMAKFCRVLDSTKAKFGIIFSRNGISGTGKKTNADRERMKIYQDRGIVVATVDAADLQRVARGENFIALLRHKYEAVRLDLRDSR